MIENTAIEKDIKKARKLLSDYRGKNYTFGIDCLDAVSKYIKEFGSETLLVISRSSWAEPLLKKVQVIFNKANIEILEIVDSAAPNNPAEDVYRLSDIISRSKPPSITCMGGGSAIDCAKAANALACLDGSGDELEMFFGTNNISRIAEERNKKLFPLIAVQLLAGSGSHLTRYSNITFPDINQKKLIVDDILVPDRAVFDYSSTVTAPGELTLDGSMDALSHSLEAYYGADKSKIGKKKYDLLEKICLISISLIIETLPRLAADLKNIRYRETIGLATDLGGYAIMFGGTSGAHLNSYSLVDVLSHGRACAILNPYYTVFFAPSISDKLIKTAYIFKDYLQEGIDIRDMTSRKLDPRQTGEIVASAMIAFARQLGYPFRLSQVKGFSKKHIDKIIEAAKNPQLEMKLKNMPVPLDADLVDEYMRPVILAAYSGDFSLIKNL